MRQWRCGRKYDAGTSAPWGRHACGFRAVVVGPSSDGPLDIERDDAL